MPGPSHASGRGAAQRWAWFGLVLALALAGSLPSGFGAEEAAVKTDNLTALSFDELMQTKVSTVYSASKQEQSVREAPATVTIVTSDDAKKFGYRTLADMLRSVPGFYVTYDRNYSYIGVRGVNRPDDFGGRVLILVDGHRVNEPIYDQAFNGQEFPVDVDLIDRVEVIQGSGSSLYGNNAAFSVINVITRKGANVDGVEASGAVASYDTFSGRLSYGKRFTNGLDLLVSGTIYDSAGHEELFYPEWSAVNNGVAENLDGGFVGQGFLSARYKDFTIEGVYGHRKKDIPTAPFEDAVFDLGPNYTIDDRAYVDLKYETELDHGWGVMGRLFYDYYGYKAEAPYESNDPANPGATVFLKESSTANFWGGEIQASKTLGEKHELTGGVEFRDDVQVVQKSYYVNPYVPNADISGQGYNVGVYVQDEYSILTNLILNVGLRYDHYSSFGGTANPRLAMIYSPWMTTTFKGIYGRAYRAPNAYESAYEIPGQYVANPDLDPERIRSYQLVWEQDFTKHVRLTTSLFYNQMEDLITQVNLGTVADPLLTFENAAAVDAYGVEVALAGRWPGGLGGRVSYTYAEARDTGVDAWLSNSPRNVAKLNLVVPIYPEKIFGGIEVLGMSARQTPRGSELDGFAVVNLTLFSQRLIKNLELSASVYNLLNAEYADPAGLNDRLDTIPQDGRNFRVKLTYRF